mmetsp:Transcript_29150/g.83555  ORF Transcript_29150/g.83555 Transcript_29150/m.83555 type:complete len:231 (-) Transcript_29150:29-721(-)
MCQSMEGSSDLTRRTRISVPTTTARLRSGSQRTSSRASRGRPLRESPPRGGWRQTDIWPAAPTAAAASGLDSQSFNFGSIGISTLSSSPATPPRSGTSGRSRQRGAMTSPRAPFSRRSVGATRKSPRCRLFTRARRQPLGVEALRWISSSTKSPTQGSKSASRSRRRWRCGGGRTSSGGKMPCGQMSSSKEQTMPASSVMSSMQALNHAWTSGSRRTSTMSNGAMAPTQH